MASKGTQFITTYMHSLKQTADLLASLGSPVSTEDMTDHVLRGLDDGYRAIIDGVNARDTPITFDDLLEKLLIQELSIGDAQRQPPAPITALNAQARSNNNRPRPGHFSAPSNQRTSNRKPFLSRCQWCNVKGHVLSDCSLFKKQHPGVPPPPRASPNHSDQAQAYTVSAGPSQTDFLVDSGATHHVTNDLANLALHHPYTGPDSLFMDNGGEYIGLHPFLSTYGISHHTTPPHTPEHNGIFERRNRHIAETGLSLLHHSGIPLTYWPHAMTTAAYLINRLPT
ncbi:retrovirus-related Pol polyprotein from transposon TNT 1-94, partial [Trifolium pratense]